MSEKQETVNCTINGICDAVKLVGDISYAIWPKEVAHQLADLNKTLLGGMRWLIDKKVEWIDARVEGGDRLREEWKASYRRATDDTAGAGI